MSTNSDLPKILVVEPNKGWQKIFSEKLSEVASLIFAETPEQAQSLIQSESDLEVITVSTSISLLNDGAGVVRFARKSGFLRPIISAGSVPANNQLLKDAGAADSTDKLYFVKYIKDLLKALNKPILGIF